MNEKAVQQVEENQPDTDSTRLPDILKWKAGLSIENDLRFDPTSCGAGLFISDENTHLRRTVEANEWRTCRAMNAGWTQGIHYWSMRVLDRGPDGMIMVGIVTQNFDVGAAIYPGQTPDSYAFYMHNGHKYNKDAIAFTNDLPVNGDVIGVLLDLEARTLTYFKNGKILGTAYGQLPVHGKTIQYYPAIGFLRLGQWLSLIKTIK